jgi:hypothetical protein
LILLSLAVVSIIVSFKVGAVFKLIGAVIFFTLGTVLLAGYDVQSVKITTDGSTVINETNYLIGNGDQDPNHTASWLGWIFIIIGVLAAVMFFLEMIPR